MPLHVGIHYSAGTLLIQCWQLDDTEGFVSEDHMNSLNDNPSPGSVCGVSCLLYRIQQGNAQP